MATKPVLSPMEALLASAEKKYNLSVGPLESMGLAVQFITTGNVAIDYALGGGIPLGRSTEFFGIQSSGKTTLAVQSAVSLQKLIIAGGDPTRKITPNDSILYLDFEQAFDPEYAKALGLDVNHPSFLFTQPDTFEDGADFALAALKTGQVKLVIVDSVPGMVPSVQAEADSVGKALPAIVARLMKSFGVTLNPILKTMNASIIFINHELEKMEMGARRPGIPPTVTTPGGVALKYFASVRVQFRQIRNNKMTVLDPLIQQEVEIPTSTDVRVKVVKNKVAPPFREATVRVRFGFGFDPLWTALQILLANKRIIYTSGRYYFHNLESIGGAPEWMPRETQGTKRPYLHGEKRVFQAADQDTSWSSLLIEEANKVANEVVDALSKVAPVREELLSDADASELTSSDLDSMFEGEEQI